MSLRYNVFLVEDDTDDQMFFVEAIKKIDASVKYTIADNGRDALDKLKVSTHNPDVIFLDINMPVIDGFTFLKILQVETHLKKIPKIILSTATYDLDKMIQFDVVACITKPSSITELQSEIENILNNCIHLK